MNDLRGHRRVPFAAPLALVLIALLAGCGTTSPSPAAPTAGPSAAQPTPPATAPATEAPASQAPATAVPTGVAVAPACEPADLKASHGIVEGGAGSLVTEVILVSASACSVDAFPALGLRDSTGAALVGGASAGPGRIDLVGGVAYASSVRLANWCAPEPSFPLTLELIVGTAEVDVTGDPFPEAGNLPPCNGDGAPILEGTAWTATP